MLLLNNRRVISEKLKSLVIDKLHEAYKGMVSMKSVARKSSVRWSSIDLDIERTVRNCIDCNESQPKIVESTLVLWNNTGKP